LPTDDINVQRFVSKPRVNVSEAAEKAGFNLRVEYPNENVAKHYKVISSDVLITAYWYASRICGQEGGILASPHNVKMAKVSSRGEKCL
jgi:hypothetical protein